MNMYIYIYTAGATLFEHAPGADEPPLPESDPAVAQGGGGRADMETDEAPINNASE